MLGGNWLGLPKRIQKSLQKSSNLLSTLRCPTHDDQYGTQRDPPNSDARANETKSRWLGRSCARHSSLRMHTRICCRKSGRMRAYSRDHSIFVIGPGRSYGIDARKSSVNRSTSWHYSTMQLQTWWTPNRSLVRSMIFRNGSTRCTNACRGSTRIRNKPSSCVTLRVLRETKSQCNSIVNRALFTKHYSASTKPLVNVLRTN